MKSSEIRLGNHRFDCASGALTDASGGKVDLRHQATEVLLALAARPNEVVERGQFISTIWENREGAEEGLVQCIAEIRRALNDDAKTVVETIPRKGYRLAARPVAPDWRRAAIAVVAVALTLGLAVWFTADMWWPEKPASAKRSVVAVLPFTDTTPDNGRPEIANALGDSITSTLARYSEFDVIARQSSFRFRDGNRDVREIGESLGADIIVQGSQGLAGNDVQVSVQVIDAANGTLRMVDAFEVPLEDILSTYDEIAFRIASTVSGSVVEAYARMPRRKGEIDALILDSRARLLFQTGPSREKWLKALDLYDEAIKDYPEIEWGYLGKALMLRTGVRFSWDEGRADDVLAEAEVAARKAIELGPFNYMAHFALGRVLMQKGDVVGSIAALERAQKLNPSSALVMNALAQSYLYADDARALSMTIAQVARVDPLPGVFTLWVRAWAQSQLGECDKARATVDAIAADPPDLKKLRAVILVCVGDMEKAADQIGEYLEGKPGWTMQREVETNAANWMTDGPLDRWISALSKAGIPG